MNQLQYKKREYNEDNFQVLFKTNQKIKKYLKEKSIYISLNICNIEFYALRHDWHRHFCLHRRNGRFAVVFLIFLIVNESNLLKKKKNKVKKGEKQRLYANHITFGYSDRRRTIEERITLRFASVAYWFSSSPRLHSKQLSFSSNRCTYYSLINQAS